MEASKGSIRKLVGKHPHTGQEYYYFPYHFIEKAWHRMACAGGAKKSIDHNQMIKDLNKKANTVLCLDTKHRLTKIKFN